MHNRGAGLCLHGSALRLADADSVRYAAAYDARRGSGVASTLAAQRLTTCSGDVSAGALRQ